MIEGRVEVGVGVEVGARVGAEEVRVGVEVEEEKLIRGVIVIVIR
jgi:hypothetical protein